MRDAQNSFNFNKPYKLPAASGLTLLELLITLTILGIIVAGLHQVMDTTLSAYDHTRNKQDLLAQARYTMERMVMFVQETDFVLKPDEASDQEILRVSERVLDTYDNTTHAYDVDGDGLLDADNDSDGLVNEDETNPDPRDVITFDLDKTEASNWKLRQVLPDYGTAALNDFMAPNVICEHVTAFKCNRLSTNLVEIELTLNKGKSRVSLKTRVKAMYVD